MSELVSILIPAYNAEKWLSESVESALSQTWPQKEIVIVDDGSTDGTLSVARSFESRIVKVIAQPNMGACSARNSALEASQGTYIQWLDADDLLSPDKISRQLRMIDTLSCPRTLLTAALGKFYFSVERAEFRPTSIWQDSTPLDWIYRKFTDGVWMNPSAWLVSRELTELAGPWDVRLNFDDDGEYFTRLVSMSENVKFVRDARAYYRVGNPVSLSSGRSDKALNSLFLSTCLCIEHMRSLEDSEWTRRACVKFLQDTLVHFFPERVDLVKKSRELAKSLGGDLSPVSESPRFSLLRKTLGWRIAKKLKNISYNAELMALRNWDRLLCSLYDG